jgi:hypothetical protein
LLTKGDTVTKPIVTVAEVGLLLVSLKDSNDELAVVLCQHGGDLVMHLKGLGRVLPRDSEDDAPTARVQVQELGHIVHLAADGDPAVRLLVVGSELRKRVRREPGHRR